MGKTFYTDNVGSIVIYQEFHIYSTLDRSAQNYTFIITACLTSYHIDIKPIFEVGTRLIIINNFFRI